MKKLITEFFYALLLLFSGMLFYCALDQYVKASHLTEATTKQIRTGVIDLELVDATKAVTFSTAMPSANYTVLFERSGAVLPSILYPATKLSTGFTLTISAGLNEDVKYFAIQD